MQAKRSGVSKFLTAVLPFALNAVIVIQGTPAIAGGSNKCAAVFSRTRISALSLNQKRALLFGNTRARLATVEINQVLEQTDPLYTIAEKLLTENNAWPEVHREGAISRVVEIKKIGDHPRYPIFQAVVEIDYSPVRGGKSRANVKFRSNGYATFLHATYRFHQSEPTRDDFKIVLRDGEGVLTTARQTALILSTLPSHVTLSRVMSPAELEIWRQGRLNQIKSGFSHQGVHFALNHYDFVPQSIGSSPAPEPVMLKVVLPHSLLADLFLRGELVINTYDSLLHSRRYGMPESARTPFGLEVELVIVGEGAKKELMPHMQRGLVVPKDSSSPEN